MRHLQLCFQHQLDIMNTRGSVQSQSSVQGGTKRNMVQNGPPDCIAGALHSIACALHSISGAL